MHKLTMKHETRIGRGAVRVGDTVRRPCGEWCPPVHALLRHLRTREIGVPEVISSDHESFEILSWIEGESGEDADGKVREEIQSDQALISMAQFIRAMHDASADFRWDAGGWDPVLRDPTGPEEIICHNDLSYSNTVFRGSEPVALIDWELAAPGSRLWDLAYACWWLVPLQRPQVRARLGWRDVDEPGRLRLFCDAYGLAADRPGLLDTLHSRQLANQRQLEVWVASGSSLGN